MMTKIVHHIRDYIGIIAGVQHTDRPLQVKYWGVRTPAALTPMRRLLASQSRSSLKQPSKCLRLFAPSSPDISAKLFYFVPKTRDDDPTAGGGSRGVAMGVYGYIYSTPPISVQLNFLWGKMTPEHEF